MKTFTIFFLLFSSTACFCMESNQKVASLKTLAAKTVANFTERLIDLDTKLPKECINSVERELPLTKDNVWRIYTNQKQRKYECEQFLVEQYQYEPITNISFKALKESFKFMSDSYKNEYNEDFFSKKIENNLNEQNIKTNAKLRKKINKIAQQCTEKLDKDAKEAEKELSGHYIVLPKHDEKHNPVTTTLKRSLSCQEILSGPILICFFCIFAVVGTFAENLE